MVPPTVRVVLRSNVNVCRGQGGYGFTKVNVASLVGDEDLGVNAKLDRYTACLPP